MSLLIRSGTPPDLISQHWVETNMPGLYLGDGYSPPPEGATILGEWAADGTLLNGTGLTTVDGAVVGTPFMPLAFQHFMEDEPRQWVTEQFLASDFSPEFSEEFK